MGNCRLWHEPSFADGYFPTFRPFLQTVDGGVENLPLPGGGDQSTVVGTIRNYLDGQHIAGKTLFCVGTDTLKRQEVSFTEGFHETVPMQAAHTDSVTISYLFHSRRWLSGWRGIYDSDTATGN